MKSLVTCVVSSGVILAVAMSAGSCVNGPVVQCEDGRYCPEGYGCALVDGDLQCVEGAVCGNGVVDFAVGESCDDRNERNHDGCSYRCVEEDVSWSESRRASPLSRIGHEMAYDAGRGRVVLFGGFGENDLFDETWEWNGRVWRERARSGRVPSARQFHGMAYDAMRGRVVLFGGAGESDLLGDTWEWDGTVWRERTPLGDVPSARAGHRMAYDARRGRVVLFGGLDNNDDLLGDTWEWDGEAWTERMPAGDVPAARIGHGMAYDAARDRLVLFGGTLDEDFLVGDTWEWDGEAWTEQISSGDSPAPRVFHGMAYDAERSRVVLLGGIGDGVLDPMWEWDGATWVMGSPPGDSSDTRIGHAMAYDAQRGRLVLFGGDDGSGGFLDDTWEWDGEGWEESTTLEVSPAARVEHGMAYDAGRGRVVLFGGGYDSCFLDDTWEWDGEVWQERRPSGVSPAARVEHGMAYDAGRRRVVLFGGAAEGGVLGDTWEWDGTVWSERTPSSGSPEAREGHRMAYDAKRGRVILFGGSDDSGGVLGDTWEWDGEAWRELTPSQGSPAARVAHGMAYDARREQVVLFGGSGDFGDVLGDTWEWDGEVWRELTPSAGSPAARVGHGMAYDAARGRVVLFGGDGRNDRRLGDTWEWDGTRWIRSSVLDSPGARARHAMVYDAARNRVVLFGGSDDRFSSETWDLQYSEQFGAEDSCVLGLDDAGERLPDGGCTHPDCWGYCQPFCPPGVSSCDGEAPRCGDDRCNALLETRELCPQDCDYNLFVSPYRQRVAVTESVSYTIELGSPDEFDGDVSFRVVTPPALDATVTLSQNRVTVPASVILTVDTTMATSPGGYELTVIATSGEFEVSRSVSLHVEPFTVTDRFRSSDTPIDIPDNDSTGIFSDILVVAPLTIYAVAVELDITHDFPQDLVIDLWSPSGTVARVHDQDEELPPSVPLPEAFRGESAADTWTLSVQDVFSPDAGTLNSWTLVISSLP